MTDAIEDTEVFELHRLAAIKAMGFAEPLEPWQDNRARAVALLRVMFANLTQEVMTGRPVDPKAVASIVTQLEELQNPKLGGDSESRSERDTGARAELAALFAGRAAAIERRDTMILTRLVEALDNLKPGSAVLALCDLVEAQPRLKGHPALVRTRQMTHDLTAPALRPPVDSSDAVPPTNNAKVSYVDAAVADRDDGYNPAEIDALIKDANKSVAESKRRFPESLPPDKPAPRPVEDWRPFVSENGISTTGAGLLGPLRQGSAWSPRRDP
jgi:hypothetical protein